MCELTESINDTQTFLATGRKNLPNAGLLLEVFPSFTGCLALLKYMVHIIRLNNKMYSYKPMLSQLDSSGSCMPRTAWWSWSSSPWGERLAAPRDRKPKAG